MAYMLQRVRPTPDNLRVDKELTTLMMALIVTLHQQSHLLCATSVNIPDIHARGARRGTQFAVAARRRDTSSKCVSHRQQLRCEVPLRQLLPQYCLLLLSPLVPQVHYTKQ